MSAPVRSAIWMSGAMVSFMLMAISGRELAGRLDTFEIMFFRSLIGIGIVVGACAWSGTLNRITSRRFGLHVIRNAFHFVGQNLWLYAVAVIPFSQLFAFEFSTPLWVALFAPLFLAERLTATRLIAAGLGFAGILMIARPGTVPITPGIIAAGFCAIGFAGAVIATKLLSRTESIASILFWLVAMQAVFGLVAAGMDLQMRLPQADDLIWVFLIGVCGLAAHFCLTKALTLAPATVVGPLDFLRLPLISVVGYLLYDEPAELLVFAGAIVVFGANYLNVRAEHRSLARKAAVS